MWQLMIRILEIIVIVWLLRFLWNNLLSGLFRVEGARSQPIQPGSRRPPPETRVVTGEMKKDPQCGTYVSTELSFKSKSRNQELHFCSRQCQEEFWKAQTRQSA